MTDDRTYSKPVTQNIGTWNIQWYQEKEKWAFHEIKKYRIDVRTLVNPDQTEGRRK